MQSLERFFNLIQHFQYFSILDENALRRSTSDANHEVNTSKKAFGLNFPLFAGLLLNSSFFALAMKESILAGI